MKYVILALSLISLPACATTDTCDDPSSQSEMTRCAQDKLVQLESELNKKRDELVAVFGNDDEFVSANKAWEVYRDAHCASVAKIYSGGSLYGYVLTECKAHQTLIRLKALEVDYHDTVNIMTRGAP